MILYVMLVGHLPYDDSDVARIVRAHREPVVYPVNAVLGESCKSFI